MQQRNHLRLRRQLLRRELRLLRFDELLERVELRCMPYWVELFQRAKTQLSERALRHQLHCMCLYELLERIELRGVSDRVGVQRRAKIQLRERVLWSGLHCVRNGRKILGRLGVRDVHVRILLHRQRQQDAMPGRRLFEFGLGRIGRLPAYAVAAGIQPLRMRYDDESVRWLPARICHNTVRRRVWPRVHRRSKLRYRRVVLQRAGLVQCDRAGRSGGFEFRALGLLHVYSVAMTAPRPVTP
jgi:hypothetical protein